MANKLKKYRVDAGLTQAKLAEIAGVTQSTYQRWETGQIPIPDGKIERLAAVLDKTPDAVLGLRKPVEAALYDAKAPDFAQYYGEVALHFKDGGDPLLLSISEKAYGQFHQDLQGDDKFFIVQSLSNQTVIIRAASIADVYFSSEAYDYYGPKDQVYLRNSPLQLPDSGDWEIIEAIAHDVIGMYDFDKNHIRRVEEILSLTSDEKFAELVAEGLLRESEVEIERSRELETQEAIFDVATNITYQLSNGQRRSFTAENEVIYDAFWELIEFPDAHDIEMIRIAPEGYHRTIFVNPNALDYISLPTHKWEGGNLEAAAVELETAEA